MENKWIPERIRRLEAYQPAEGECAIRLDANESPFAPTDEMRKAFAAALNEVQFQRYPEPAASGLISAYSEKYRLPPELIVAGNGSDELISLICTAFLLPGDRMAVTAPDFSMYAFYGNLAGAEMVTFEKDRDLCIDSEKLVRFVKENRVRLLIFSNPCNPTGRLLSRKEVYTVVRETEALVVVDEAYMEFCEEGESVLPLIGGGEHPNLIVLKTLSKAYGFAAARIGFAVGERAIAEAIRKVKSPYNLNAVSQKLGEVMLSFSETAKKNIHVIKENRSALERALTKGEGDGAYRLYPSATNFVLLRFKDTANGTGSERAKEMFESLKREGILVRYILGDCLRITAGTEKENDALLSAFFAHIA